MMQLGLLVRERTNIAVDVNFKSANHVIVIGRYRNSDYVQTYSIPEKDLFNIIAELKEMEKYGNAKRIDAPPIFKAVFERDVKHGY
jgi:hypothetical protein